MKKSKKSDLKSDQMSQFTIDNSNQKLTTNDGVSIYDNNNTLKVGDRGPSLQQDHIYFDKLGHFDRERIPERVVHARGSGAHGILEIHEDISEYSCAKFLQKGKTTPLFIRFSTVAGFKGSTDLARDVRGFSVKFYTEDGNYDLVGNNIPVFFIQDAMNFPDLIHAVKPEPDKEIPQAASAHDTFWDFISLMPESAHMIMWAMSDRAIPRSLRMMEGFGVHTFKLINEKGKATFVKFHWKPKLGVHSVAWNEAQKISGFNSDFHRQDLWEAIDEGNFPQWDLGVQLIPEEDELKYSFDILDATKLVPEELVPVKIIGTMTLNRNPDNFFAETEQVAFDPGRIIPGIDLSDDPLLQGRIFSYIDTQNYRLGGANFHEIPINRSLNQKHNNQKDGTGRMDILKGSVSYFPNSKASGCPYHAMLKGEEGFQSHEQKVEGKKVRVRSDSFADHFSQATLFFNSQSKPEKQHIIDAFSFELSKVTDPKIRERQVAILYQIDKTLAQKVGDNLGIKPPKELDELTLSFARQNHPNYPIQPKKQEINSSDALSMKVKEGEGTIKTRKVAFLVDNGVSKKSVDQLKKALEKEGAQAVLISSKVGELTYEEGSKEKISHSYLTDPSVCYDAVFTPSGKSIESLKLNSDYYEFINDSYRHCKILAFAKGAGSLMDNSFVKLDRGVILEDENENWIADFIQVMKLHRIWDREEERKVPS
ncbi:catalase [Empedobacter falsenii]|uniref:catalase n=1 Tax=Empedobacter falsenii TaxID=343874 RepID=UPI002577B890|nr:catalase [Empedobacter falsenii]MDM1297290.1 catalase [Empedobacter falsenii]MDM1317083.1 catalase [Empedobacter falsenii]